MVAQLVPQAPQLAASVSVSTHRGHAGAQAVAPPSHVQAPPVQVPRPQDWPHPPQLAAPVVVSTQWPAQQAEPAPHATEQRPQCAASTWRSAQVPSQSVSPEAHLSAGQPERKVAARRAAGTRARRVGRMGWP